MSVFEGIQFVLLVVFFEGVVGMNYLFYVDDNYMVKCEWDLFVFNFIDDFEVLGVNDVMVIVVVLGIDLKVLSGWFNDWVVFGVVLQCFFDFFEFCGIFCLLICNVCCMSFCWIGFLIDSVFVCFDVIINVLCGGFLLFGEGCFFGNFVDFLLLLSVQ